MAEGESVLPCTQEEPELFFPHGENKPLRGNYNAAAIKEAVAICRLCVEREECLEGALERDEEFGIWGGLTTYERKSILRRRNKRAS